LRCLALVAAAPAKRGLEELLFKFFQGFVETNILFEHFSNELLSQQCHPEANSRTILLPSKWFQKWCCVED